VKAASLNFRARLSAALLFAFAVANCSGQPGPVVLDTQQLVEGLRSSANMYSDEKLAKSITAYFYTIPGWSKAKFDAEYEFALIALRDEKRELIRSSLAGVVSSILKQHAQGRERLQRDWVAILGLFQMVPASGHTPLLELLEAKSPEVIEEQQVLPLIAAAKHCSGWNQARLLELPLARSASLDALVKPLRELVSDESRIVWAVNALAKRKSFASGWTRVVDLLIDVNSAEAAEPLRKLLGIASAWPKSEEVSRWWRISARSKSVYRRTLFR
jgi:hypothetical protein